MYAVITTNVLGLCDGGELKAQMLNSTKMPNISTNVELSTVAPLSQNPCYLPFLLLHFGGMFYIPLTHNLTMNITGIRLF